jgi:GTP-binding protein of the ras superfamily involved in termination of M-phase
LVELKIPELSNQSEMSEKQINIKVGMLGDVQVGKTSLMVKYVENRFDEDYIQTLGVSFLEKNYPMDNSDVQISIMLWDLAGQKEFREMLEVVCSDAVALFFMFDLTRKATLHSVKEWYLQSRKYNKKAVPFLVGTKFDKFLELSESEQQEVTLQARKYASIMKSPLVFCSAAAGINIKKLFRLVMCKVFDLQNDIEPITNIGEPIIEF